MKGATHNCAGRELCLGVRRGGLSGAWGGVIGPTAPPGLGVEMEIGYKTRSNG